MLSFCAAFFLDRFDQTKTCRPSRLRSDHQRGFETEHSLLRNQSRDRWLNQPESVLGYVPKLPRQDAPRAPRSQAKVSPHLLHSI
jgi:hypothetical protein